MAKKPGVGYVLPPGSQAGWGESKVTFYPMDLSARPWGPTGGIGLGAPLDREVFKRRYGVYPGEQPQGFAADHYEFNGEAGHNWWAAQPQAHRDQWDGEPLEEEKMDIAVSHGRRANDFYQAHWWEPGRDGGTPERPVVIFDAKSYNSYKGRGGLNRIGLYSIPNAYGYQEWFDVRFLPADLPPPKAPPAVGSAVEFWEQGANGFVPGKVKAVRGSVVTLTGTASGKSADFDMADEDRRWRRTGAAPAPTPAPPSPPPTPPAPTPKPEPPKPTPGARLLADLTPFTPEAMKAFDEAPTWEELKGKRGKIARLSRLAREAQAIQAAILAARGKS